MVKTQVITKFMRTNRVGVLTAIIVFILGISWIIPPHESVFVLQRYLQETYIVLLGIMSVPFWIISDKLTLAFVTVQGFALLYGAVTQFSWSAGWSIRLVLVAILCLNCFMGFTLLSIGVGDGSLNSPVPRILCEDFTSSINGVQIAEYLQSFSDGGAAQYFYLSTQDGGQQWRQIGSAKYAIGISSCGLVNKYGITEYSFSTCKPENVNRRPPACALGGALMDE